ncbi:MAG TPA: MBL fold metallo-hydrolase [Blastocatellia bacterium]|nr:MBL fold metallo-hydrolase [Blastocatellia bacterium]
MNPMDLIIRREHRLRLVAGLLVGMLALLAPERPIAQSASPVDKINAEAAKADISVKRLRENLNMLKGSGGNIVALCGSDGLLLVDAGIAVSRPKIEAALESVSRSPLKYLINTHWHWDHTDGNEWMHDRGATIVAHENALKRMAVTTRVEEWNFTFPPWPAGGRPTVTYTKDKTLKFNGEVVELRNYGRGHTDGDTSVYFRNADVLALGDTWWNGHYPFIDNGVGGGIDGMIVWANASISLATNKTLIIPGHGPIGDRAQLAEFRDMLVTIREAVARLKKEGKTLDAVIDARPTAAFDKKWGGFVIDGAFFTRLVYAGV